MEAERIGVIGSGDVGRALGRGFAGRGWDVLVGTRNPDSLAEWVADVDAPGDGSAAVGSFADAAGHGDVVVLAVRGDAALDVLDLADPGNFAGRLVLDTTNPLDFSGGGPPHLFVGGTDSLGEQVQAALPDARVVKCFNTVSNTQMVDPTFGAETPRMFICGNDDGAKERTEAILVDLGWPGALDVGDIRSSRYLEALVPLWVRVGAVLDTYEHAFAVVQ